MREKLTERELEVLVLLADGNTQQDIGRELYLAPATIKTYVKQILKKMAARNTTHAVALAYHNGILFPKIPLNIELCPLCGRSLTGNGTHGKGFCVGFITKSDNIVLRGVDD